MIRKWGSNRYQSKGNWFNLHFRNILVRFLGHQPFNLKKLLFQRTSIFVTDCLQCIVYHFVIAHCWQMNKEKLFIERSSLFFKVLMAFLNICSEHSSTTPIADCTPWKPRYFNFFCHSQRTANTPLQIWLAVSATTLILYVWCPQLIHIRLLTL
jgi:hypothetical protein